MSKVQIKHGEEKRMAKKKSVKKSVKKGAKKSVKKGKGINKVLLIILAIILPPLAVYLKKGAGQDLVINILLCFVFWIPAIIHALWLVTK
jgi:uncharacterized membrane protein YqaE (UPF0057 family)